MRLLRIALALVVLPLVAPARADDTVTRAKLGCQLAFGSDGGDGYVCQQGVELFSRSDGDLAHALGECTRSFEEPSRQAACRHGVRAHHRAAHDRSGDTEKSEFVYTWKREESVIGFQLGDYEFLAGNARRAMEECLEAFDGYQSPPSCLAGFTVRQKE